VRLDIKAYVHQLMQLFISPREHMLPHNWIVYNDVFLPKF